MRAIDRKLLRDLRRLWAQALAIALVLACGVMVILMSWGMSAALDATRAAYYERNRFADLFAEARRVPNTLLPEIAAIPGIARVEARVTASAILDIPGREETAMGRLIGLPPTGPPGLNVPILRSGAWPDPAETGRVVVNARFAEANGFRIGDRFEANLNGARRRLTIAGTALSPEFIYTIGPGALVPDDANYGILWMPRQAIEAAWDLEGAFNDLALDLTRGADEAEVIAALDRLLEPFGGTGAHGRDLQVSHSFVESEIASLKAIAAILPPVFLGITVFLLNMVIGRIILLERAEIGLLKAIGYGDAEICLHYVLLALLIAAIGIAIGWAGGRLMARWLAETYARFYDFPYLIYRMPLSVYAISALAGVAAASLGALRSALRAARLPPAVAMSPPAPPRYRRGLLDRGAAALRLAQTTMMILRSLLRFPLRAAMTALGLALAVAVIVASGFFGDALDEIMEVAFYQANRQDAMLLFSDGIPLAAVAEARRLPGVLQAEPQTYLPAILRHGHLEKRASIEARPPGTDLSRIVDESGAGIDAAPGGIVLSDRLAARLGARVGDPVEVAFLGATREVVDLPVSDIVTQFFGLGAHMDAETLDRMLRRGRQLSVVNVALDESRIDAFHAALKEMPGLAGVIFMTENRRSFMATIRQNMMVMTGIYGLLGVLITIGVAYNAARVQLSERARELASLRILGFTRGEVAYVLIGEITALAFLAQPLGWWLGALIARLMTERFSSDLYSIPLVLEWSSFGQASLVVLAATAGSLVLVRRRLDRLDLVAVMKTRE